MQAVIMAGGKGTRLRPFTNVLPKPLVPIGETPILEIVLRQLRHYGFEEALLAVGHKAELIMAIIGDGSRLGIRVRYHHESQPLGTMGALRCFGDALDEQFVVMNGDICTDLNFADLYRAHQRADAPVTVATYPRQEKIELGVLDVDPESRRITQFREKPTFDFLVSMGVNALSRSVLELIPAGEAFGFDDLMHAMLERRLPIGTFPFSGRWHDIGRPDDYLRVCEEYEAQPEAYLPADAHARPKAA